MEMIEKETDSFNERQKKNKGFTRLSLLLKFISKHNKNNPYIFEYGLYARMKNFIRIVCLKVYNKEILEAKINLEELNGTDLYIAYID
ncbi:hypothetical protein A5886_001545, partial [Enterococcus sp. 8G7_MSG3316]